MLKMRLSEVSRPVQYGHSGRGRSVWQGQTLGAFHPELWPRAIPESAPLHRHPCGPTRSCHGYPTLHEDPEVQGMKVVSGSHGRGRIRTRGHLLLPFPHHGWLRGGPGTTILPGRRAAIWEGSVQQMLVEDLLLSVEYDEFLPHGLQALLEVSILPKSREGSVNDGAPSREP